MPFLTNRMERIFSQEEIHDIAGALVQKLLPNAKATVLALSGDLGAGKTTLVQEVGSALGITMRMPSPTFVIMRRYPIHTLGYKNLIHIDAYRLNLSDELLKLGWNEIVNNPENIICIEWPERVPELIPEDAYTVSLEHVGENQRKIKLHKI